MFLLGLCLTVFGAPLAVTMMRNLYLVSEYPYLYHYTNGFSEESVATMAILFSFVAIAGIVLMIVGWTRRRNKAALKSIINAEAQNYCGACHINVAAQYTHCPVCGRPLKREKGVY